MSRLDTFTPFGRRHAFPLSLYAVAFTIPFPTLVNNVAIIVLSLVWLFTIRKDWRSLRNSILLLSAFLPFYIWHVFGISYSNNTSAAVKLVLERGATFFIFPLILFTSRQEYFSLKGLLYAFAAGFLIILSVSIGEILLKIIHAGEPLSSLLTYYTRWNFTENASLSYHTPYMGLHAVFAYAVLLVCFKAGTLAQMLLKLALLGLLVLGIYLFGAKLPFLLLLIVSLVSLAHQALSGKLSFSTINVLAAAVLLCLSSFIYLTRDQLVQAIVQNTKAESLYWGSLPNRLVKFLESGDQDRLDNWKAAYCAFSKQPLVGAGAGDGLASLQACRPATSWNYIHEVNTHNQYLGIAVRSGVIGLLLLLLGFASCLRLSFLFRDKLYLLFLISFTVALTLENFLDRQKGIVFFTLINAAFLSYYLVHDSHNKGKDKLKREQLNG